MDLTNCPTDWIQDIFVHLDFAGNRCLRRCCREWMQLLTNPRTQQVITLDCTPKSASAKRRNPFSVAAFAAVIGNIDTLIIKGSHCADGKCRQCQDVYLWYTVTAELTVASNSPAYHPIRLVVTDMELERFPNDLVGRCMRAGAVISVELHHFTIPLLQLIKFLSRDLMLRSVPLPKTLTELDIPAVLCSMFYQIPNDAPKQCKLLHSGRMSNKEPISDIFQFQPSSFRRQILVNIMAPCSAELRTLQARVATKDQALIHRLIRAIMVEYQLKDDITESTSPGPLDISRCHPIVLWILFCWVSVTC